VVDEADRLQMNSLERMRSIFDDGSLGMILIGMPGIEKRIARFPQFYSRIGFVHEFRPLGDGEMQELLERRWAPAGVRFSEGTLTPEVIARLIRNGVWQRFVTKWAIWLQWRDAACCRV
jgi:type II secretory pathway predicted ATPase ExeA